ncbi:glycosyltransferase family 4 protein [Aeromicrobium duanguangcaii]|uniref:Glycosyltransferase family 4 protein n=1 Tax=Aeromicrobium duanguangcaii TaxID=2968086 RepID=A0ABY5KD75_9ACTN|nr:glycosyltransferase family 4 protein [Aeromicrobium duanguangcaii]MCD9154525.1 glycosyltransferase family 4 protein [Aeromicrobium duanguangcaii]UUI68419.1 glycosyltransferase family 4 protein [Aeromicrobium duanguangcaii]
MTLRVAVVTHSDVEGGAEIYLQRLYRELPEVEVKVFGRLPGWDGAADELELSPKWSRSTLASGWLRLRRERRRVRDAVERFAPDVIHLQFKREQIGFTRVLSEIAPVVWTEHGVMPRAMRIALGSMYRRAARHATSVITVSDAVGRQVAPVVGDDKVRVIENGVDATAAAIASAAARELARHELGIGEGPVAVWVGRLDVGKRPGLAIEILNAWDGNLVIAGDGPLRDEVERGAAANPRVHYVGRVDPAALYRAADVLLMTSDGRSEGLPYVILEAAAFGVPAVATDIDVFRDPVLASGGAVVSGVAPVAWAEAADRLTGDPSRRSTVRAWAQEHDLPRWRDRHREVFEAAVVGSGPG